MPTSICHFLKLQWFCAAAGLRNRDITNKAQIVSEVEKNVWPAVVLGKVKPVVYKTFPLSEAAESHKLMETSSHIGKILLIPWLGMCRVRWETLRPLFLCWTMHGHVSFWIVSWILKCWWNIVHNNCWNFKVLLFYVMGDLGTNNCLFEAPSLLFFMIIVVRSYPA
jgi:hypothetical protein